MLKSIVKGWRYAGVHSMRAYFGNTLAWDVSYLQRSWPNGDALVTSMGRRDDIPR